MNQAIISDELQTRILRDQQAKIFGSYGFGFGVIIALNYHVHLYRSGGAARRYCPTIEADYEIAIEKCKEAAK